MNSFIFFVVKFDKSKKYNPLLKLTTTTSLPGFNVKFWRNSSTVDQFTSEQVIRPTDIYLSDQDDESESVSSLFIGFVKLNHKKEYLK